MTSLSAHLGDHTAAGAPVVPPLDLAALAARLREGLGEALAPAGGFGGLRALCPAGPFRDSVTTLVVHDPQGRPNGVVQCSASRAAGAADLVRREVERAQAASVTLGPRLGEVLVAPLLVVDDGERTYAGYPLCRALPDSRVRWVLVRACLRGALFDWLYEVARSTRREPAPDELGRDFTAPLQAVAGDARLPAALRAGADEALARLASGRWRPAYTLAHGDLWRGNVLRWPARTWWRERPPRAPFALIDWRGSRARGHAVVDLLRLGESLRASVDGLRRELARHCWALGCAPRDARGYLLAAIGAAGADLGCIAPRRWALGAEALWGQLLAAQER